MQQQEKLCSRPLRLPGLFDHLGNRRALAGAVVLGDLLSRPAPAPTRPPVLRSPTGAPLGGCMTTTGTGTWYGRPAQFSGTMCYDPAGRAYVLPNSKQFVGYLR